MPYNLSKKVATGEECFIHRVFKEGHRFKYPIVIDVVNNTLVVTAGGENQKLCESCILDLAIQGVNKESE